MATVTVGAAGGASAASVEANVGLLRGIERRWLVTGAAGFIGSSLIEALLRAGQRVIGLDNFQTGFRRNLDEVRALVGDVAWSRFRFVEGDIRDAAACREALAGSVDVVLHQAALGSVLRSVEQPLHSYSVNVDGFVKLLDAAREAGVSRFVYASSSSVYGDDEGLPKVENRTGSVLSPYAATKAANEMFADTWARVYGMTCIGLRYFNVFGPRQNPDGDYAAVVPHWVASLLSGKAVWINGDGLTSRDFCYVANVVQANLRAGLVECPSELHEVFNVAVGERTTLMELFAAIKRALSALDPAIAARLDGAVPRFREFRAGDVRHSLADIGRACTRLGYAPTHRVDEGLAESIGWYVSHGRTA